MAASRDRKYLSSRRFNAKLACAYAVRLRCGQERDVLHLWHCEQTACFMVLRNWPIGGPSSILSKPGKPLKTVDATHPFEVPSGSSVLCSVTIVTQSGPWSA